MRPLRYSINVTLDGCCDHRAGLADEELHRHAVENLNRTDAFLFGRATYEMMEAGALFLQISGRFGARIVARHHVLSGAARLASVQRFRGDTARSDRVLV